MAEIETTGVIGEDPVDKAVVTFEKNLSRIVDM